MNKFFALLVFVTINLSAETELFPELYMENQAGGFVVLTVEDCNVPKINKIFPNRAYATEPSPNGDIIHEGCWTTEQPPPGEQYIALFNIWFEPDTVVTFPHKLFGPIKKRLDQNEI